MEKNSVVIVLVLFTLLVVIYVNFIGQVFAENDEYSFGFNYAGVYEKVPRDTNVGFFVHNGYDDFQKKFDELNGVYKLVDIEVLAGDGNLKVASVYKGKGKSTIKGPFNSWKSFTDDFFSTDMMLIDVERYLDIKGQEHFIGLYTDGKPSKLMLHNNFKDFVNFMDKVYAEGYYATDVDLYRINDGPLQVLSVYNIPAAIRSGLEGQLYAAKDLYGGKSWHQFYTDLYDYSGGNWVITDWEPYDVYSGLALVDNGKEVEPAHFNPKYLGIFHKEGRITGETEMSGPAFGTYSNSVLEPVTGWLTFDEIAREFGVAKHLESGSNTKFALIDIEMCYIPHYTVDDYGPPSSKELNNPLRCS